MQCLSATQVVPHLHTPKPLCRFARYPLPCPLCGLSDGQKAGHMPECAVFSAGTWRNWGHASPGLLFVGIVADPFLCCGAASPERDALMLLAHDVNSAPVALKHRAARRAAAASPFRARICAICRRSRPTPSTCCAVARAHGMAVDLSSSASQGDLPWLAAQSALDYAHGAMLAQGPGGDRSSRSQRLVVLCKPVSSARSSLRPGKV